MFRIRAGRQEIIKGKLFKMSFCSSCGANVNDADRFCSKCGKPIAITTPQPRIQMQPQTIRSNEVQYSIKEIRQKHRLEYKKMTRSAKARILDKKNDSSYLPLAGDSNKLSFHNSNTNWANYVFEVDGKTYSGYDIVHPLQRTCRILYNPEDPSKNRTKYARTMDILRSPVFSFLMGILILVIMILTLRLCGITFW
jgi:predicted nucleic acid-binding Zn ribbon protein